MNSMGMPLFPSSTHTCRENYQVFYFVSAEVCAPAVELEVVILLKVDINTVVVSFF